MSLPFKVVNIVCTASLSSTIDLHSLPQRFPGDVVHDPEIYSGRAAYFKSESMKGKVSIFHSGNLISVGTRSVVEAIRELNLVARAFNAPMTEPNVRNIVATASLGRVVDLEQISLIIELPCIYEPEQFPGAIIRIPLREETRATILLFSSGKLVCVGLKNIDNIKEAIENLVFLIERYESKNERC